VRMYKLTHERLFEVLEYDPETGIFVWKIALSNRVKAGNRAGVFHQQSGGRYISIDNEKFMAHRLAFFYVNKHWANTDVRPLDGDYDNCSIANLREVSRVELQHERGKVSTNTSGFAGVSRAKDGKWQAKITWEYKQVNLGASFKTAEEAAEMYEEAARRLKAGVSTSAERKRVLTELNLWRRQKTAWNHLNRSHQDHELRSFEAFCADVSDTPKSRYAMVAEDVTKPIGPRNFRWALPIDAEHHTRDGIIAYHRAVRQANRDHERNKWLQRNYNITFADELRLRNAQQNACAICECDFGDAAPCVDHDHKTLKVRGLLCKQCNYALGQFGDNARLLRRAADYIEQHNASTWKGNATRQEDRFEDNLED
jgi:Recombination endonuclease VII